MGNTNYYNGTIPFIRSGEINKSSTAIKISKLGLDNSSAKMVKKGDVLYALYGATSGEVGLSNINGAINQAVLALTTKDGYFEKFIMQWLKKEKFKIIGTYIQGGQGNLSGSIIKNLEIKIPNSSEQLQISNLLKQIDTLITLHQRK